MINFKKAYTTKIISIFIINSFVATDFIYSYPLSYSDTLRVPVYTQNTQERMREIMEVTDKAQLTSKFYPRPDDLKAEDLPGQIEEFWEDVHHLYMNLDNSEEVRKEALEKAFRIAARKHDREAYPTSLEIWKNAKDIITEFYIKWPGWDLWEEHGTRVWKPALDLAKEVFKEVDENGMPIQFWLYKVLVEAIKPAMKKDSQEYNEGLVREVIKWLNKDEPDVLKVIAARILSEMQPEEALGPLKRGVFEEKTDRVVKAYIKAIKEFGKTGYLRDNVGFLKELLSFTKEKVASDGKKDGIENDINIAAELVEIWGDITFSEKNMEFQNEIKVFLVEIALGDNDRLANIAVQTLANMPISKDKNIPEDKKTSSQQEKTSEVLKDMYENSPKKTMKKELGEPITLSAITKIESQTGSSIGRLLSFLSTESDKFMVKIQPRTVAEIKVITPAEAAEGKPAQKIQYAFENLEYLRPFWDIGIVHSNPIDLYYIKNSDKNEPKNWVLVKGGNDYTLSMDFIGTRIFQLAGLPTPDVSLIRLKSGELALAIGYLDSFLDGGYELPHKYHNDQLIQAGLLFDVLIQSEDRNPSNMLFKTLHFNVNKSSAGTKKSDRVFNDFGFSGISRAAGGLMAFSSEVTEQSIVRAVIGARIAAMDANQKRSETLMEIIPRENVSFVNEAYWSVIEDYQRGGKRLFELAEAIGAMTDTQIKAIVEAAGLPKGEANGKKVINGEWIPQQKAEIFEDPNPKDPSKGFWNRKNKSQRTGIIDMLEKILENQKGDITEFMIQTLISRRDSLVRLIQNLHSPMIANLYEPLQNNKDDLGGKGKSLLELSLFNIEGASVPHGFVITASAFRQFLESYQDIKEKIEELDKLSQESTPDSKTIDEKSEEIKEQILSKEIPEHIKNTILKTYRTFIGEKKDVYVSVRSSALAEDMKTASFAGQYETVLHVRSEEAVLRSVKAVWASLFNKEATRYRNDCKISHAKNAMAVVIQEMVEPDVSGVIFTVDNRMLQNRIIIEAVYGLGEGLVGGSVQPDHWAVSRTESKGISERWLGAKNKGFFGIQGEGIQEEKIPEDKRKAFSLEDETVRRLADISMQLEKKFKMSGLDIEFAYKKGKIFILQARPIVNTPKIKGIQWKNVKEMERKELEGLTSFSSAATGRLLIIDIEKLQKEKSIKGLNLQETDAELFNLASREFKNGDILVVRDVHPYWAPLLRRAGGIIMESGGTTSHASVVAGERQIPCIVSVRNVLSYLREWDKRIVTLDSLNHSIYSGRVDLDEIDLSSLDWRLGEREFEKKIEELLGNYVRSKSDKEGNESKEFFYSRGQIPDNWKTDKRIKEELENAKIALDDNGWYPKPDYGLPGFQHKLYVDAWKSIKKRFADVNIVMLEKMDGGIYVYKEGFEAIFEWMREKATLKQLEEYFKERRETVNEFEEIFQHNFEVTPESLQKVFQLYSKMIAYFHLRGPFGQYVTQLLYNKKIQEAGLTKVQIWLLENRIASIKGMHPFNLHRHMMEDYQNLIKEYNNIIEQNDKIGRDNIFKDILGKDNIELRAEEIEFLRHLFWHASNFRYLPSDDIRNDKILSLAKLVSQMMAEVQIEHSSLFSGGALKPDIRERLENLIKKYKLKVKIAPSLIDDLNKYTYDIVFPGSIPREEQDELKRITRLNIEQSMQKEYEHHLQTRLQLLFREKLIELAERLVKKGLIKETGDIFNKTPEEIINLSREDINRKQETERPENMILFDNPDELAKAINANKINIYDGINASWNKKMESGNIFKYDLSEVRRRQIGRLAAMFNPRRAGKRPAQMETTSLNQKFDPNKFNFNKVKDSEIIAKEIDLGGVDTDIIVNVNPFLKGHILIVPERKKEHNQYFIPQAATVALEILKRVNRKNYKVAYNSVGAFASINHLHLQALDYQQDRMPIEEARKELLFEREGVSIWILPDWFLKGFVLTSDNTQALQSQLLKLTSILHKLNQPFNIIFSYDEPEYNIYVLPRRFEGPSKFGTGVAYLEAGGEILFVKQEDKTMEESLRVYEQAMEEDMAEEVSKVGIDSNQFNTIIRPLYEKFKDLQKVRGQV